MTKERLSFLSLDELKTIAKRFKIDGPVEDRESLIEEIAEAFDDSAENQMATNLAMYIKRKKFELFLGGSDCQSETEFFEDPYASQIQCETQIHFLLRDPHWGFAYWKFSKSDFFLIKTKKLPLLLRVFQFDECREWNPGMLTEKNAYFDIEISHADSKWYINLPCSGYNYAIQLMALEGETKRVLASGNTIYNPKVVISKEIRPNIDETIIQSGLYDSFEANESAPSNSRILSDEEMVFKAEEEAFA